MSDVGSPGVRRDSCYVPVSAWDADWHTGGKVHNARTNQKEKRRSNASERDLLKKKLLRNKRMYTWLCYLKKKSLSCQSISGVSWISSILSMTFFCTQYFKWNKIWEKRSESSVWAVQYVNVSDWWCSGTAWGNGTILIILYVNLTFASNLCLPARCY